MGRRKLNQICPVCGGYGTGPYSRWVRNSQKVKYEPYFYFKHVVEEQRAGRVVRKIRWCYLTREQAQECARERAKKLGGG